MLQSLILQIRLSEHPRSVPELFLELNIKRTCHRRFDAECEHQPRENFRTRKSEIAQHHKGLDE
jgi:hypothetical protein